MKIEQLSTYELLEKHTIEELDSVAYLLKHKKSFISDFVHLHRTVQDYHIF